MLKEMVKITIKMWIMFAFVLFALISIFSIPPVFMKKGVLVSSVEKNSSVFEQGLRTGMIITKINNYEINNLQDYSNAIQSILAGADEIRIDIITDKTEIVGLFEKKVVSDISVDEIPDTRIKTGLDLRGGIRALVTAEDHKLTDSELDDLIAVSQERLNVYGLTDLNIRQRTDSSGNKFMLVEIAGSSPSDLESLIAQQGKFEAKIGNETIFSGGSRDITYVAKSGQDAGIYDCNSFSGGESCTFRFVIYLSEAAAQRQADATANLSLNVSAGGKYLEKQLDLYLDNELIDSLNIGADLKGKVATQIQISGPGTGATRQEAINDAQDNMKKLQTVLITGSLPFKLQIVKIDKISPTLGHGFVRTILIAGLLGAAGVFLVIFLRYRKIKISAIMLFMMLSEILITLGVAALIGWNIDLAGIAGIIAAIGTGVDDQIVIVDESSRSKYESLKNRIKNALFIIFTAYATSVVALLPLLNAGAGLLAGFAVTTLIGITAGVFITRPAFADIVRQLGE